MNRGDGGGYRHYLLTFRDPEELVAAGTPFLIDGLERGEVAALVCRDQLSARIAAALPPGAPLLVLRQSDVYTRAAAAVSTYLRLMPREVERGVPRVRLIGEVAFGATREAWAEWTRFEAAVNVALADCPLSCVCAYDASALPRSVLTAAGRTHPLTLTATETYANPGYAEPDTLMRELATDGLDAAERSPGAALTELANHRQYRRLRAELRTSLAGAGVVPAVRDEFGSAVHEIAVNAVAHGKPPVRVRLWTSTDRLVCTVTDHGRGFDDPVAGYAPDRGTGLWLARQSCDRISMTHDRDGFTVRLVTDLH